MLEYISMIANIATAAALFVAAWQLVLTRNQSVTSFEDSFAREYRELAAKIPTKAFLSDPLTEEEYRKHFDEMYHYFDLCNEQVFLRKTGRISEKTWIFWKDGIASNMKRPAFERAWSEIAYRANGDFSELRAIFPPKAFSQASINQNAQSRNRSPPHEFPAVAIGYGR